jgi:ABC-type branched-subunit amino acid transport system permease subunit
VEDTKAYKTAAFWIVFILVFALAPLRMTSNYQIILANQILIWGMFAVAFNMLFGVTGMLSFGQALYYGLGAYAVGLSFKYLGASWFLPAIGMGLVGAVVLSVLVGLLIIRVSGVFFTVLTLAFGQLVWQITFRWYNFTGGDDGIQGIIPPGISGRSHCILLLHLMFGPAVYLVSEAARPLTDGAHIAMPASKPRPCALPRAQREIQPTGNLHDLLLFRCPCRQPNGRCEQFHSY